LGDEGATVRLSSRDVIIDLSSGRAHCDDGSPDVGTGDEVVQWCIEPAGVYLYAVATGRAGTGILDGLVAGLEIRSYRPAD
jgi:hypothetical protein